MTTLKATFLFLLPLVSVVAAAPTPTTEDHLIGDEANVNAGFEPELSLLPTETLKVERRQPSNNPPPRYLPVQPPPPTIPLPAAPGQNPNPPAYVWPPARPDSPVLPAPVYDNQNTNANTQAKTTKKTKNRKRSITPTALAEIARRQPANNPPPRYLPMQPPPPTIPLPAAPGQSNANANPPAYVWPPARPDSPILPAPQYPANTNANANTQAKKTTNNGKKSGGRRHTL